MCTTMLEKFGGIAPTVKPAVLRYFYRDLTGHAAAATDMEEAEVDERVKEFLQMEPDDPNIVFDLREVKRPEGKTKYDVFWNEAEKFINEDVGMAVEDRRHGQVTHLAKVISIRDFREQVTSCWPEGTIIPSEEWLQLQLWPNNAKRRAALHYTGRLNVRYMIQARQFRKAHEDEHYTASVFQYLHVFAVRFQSVSQRVCLDDKCRIKVGETDLPVAAVERGRRVPMKMGTSFEVGDHDFTKLSMIPSIALVD